MKTNIYRLCLLLIVLNLSLTSCNKDDDNVPSEPETATATVKYSIGDRYELSKLVDIKVYYTNNEGKEVNEVITTPTWEKTLTKAPVPGIYQMKVTYVRNDKPLEQENYTLGTGLTLSVVTSNGNIESIGKTGSAIISKSQIEKYLQKLTEEKVSIEITK